VSRAAGGSRFTLVKGICLLAATVLLARLVHVQVIEHQRYRAEADRQWLQAKTIQPRRGDLYDRHGRPLAITVASCRVGVAASLVEDPQALGRVLAPVLGRDAEQLAREIRRAGDEHVVLSRQAFLDESQQRLLRRFPAVTLDEQIDRVYPLDGVGASWLGFFREDPDSSVHATGLELGLDELLVGRPGKAMRVRSARAGEDHGEVVVTPAHHGADLLLTLDADLQEIAETHLREAVADSRARAGSVLILDPHAGDVLAAASWPLLGSRNRPVAEASYWIDRNVTAAYEPGSVFKVFTAAALLASGAVDTATVIDCTDHDLGGFSIGEAAGHRFGRLGFMAGFSQSSNVWFARAVTNLAAEEQYRTLLDFGFGRGTGVPYPGEGDGILAPPAAWSRRSQATIAIGQEVAVTPLQLGLAVAAVANGGTLFAPRVWTEARDSEGRVIARNEPAPLRQVLPRGLDRVLREAMRRVVLEGTGEAVRRDWISIGGKTGTAQKSVPGRGYRDGLHSASFVGMLPIENPRLVIVTVLDEPRGIKHYASQSAAPLFGAVVDDIRRTTGWLTDVDRSSERLVIGPRQRERVVPDVMFLGSDGAVLRLEQAGFAVHGAEQQGRVMMQVPAAGSLATAGSAVTLTVRSREGHAAQVCPDLTGLSNRQVRALAARLGIPVRMEGVGYVTSQHPAPGEGLDGDGLEVRMVNAWP
jgi:cell division protein FtsI/penicillin-binding protein 2